MVQFFFHIFSPLKKRDFSLVFCFLFFPFYDFECVIIRIPSLHEHGGTAGGTVCAGGAGLTHPGHHAGGMELMTACGHSFVALRQILHANGAGCVFNYLILDDEFWFRSRRRHNGLRLYRGRRCAGLNPWRCHSRCSGQV